MITPFYSSRHIVSLIVRCIREEECASLSTIANFLLHEGEGFETSEEAEIQADLAIACAIGFGWIRSDGFSGFEINKLPSAEVMDCRTAKEIASDENDDWHSAQADMAEEERYAIGDY
jgi:hypothetical protein